MTHTTPEDRIEQSIDILFDEQQETTRVLKNIYTLLGDILVELRKENK
jgi:hypothetical protein